MEILQIYTFRDKKSGRSDVPFFSHDEVFAKRKFIMACQDKSTMLGQFKDDFCLDLVGEFNVIESTITEMKETVLSGDQITYQD